MKIPLLIFVLLLAGIFLCFPLLHQLHHDGFHEPATCPFHLLQSTLILLFFPLFQVLLFRPPRARSLRVSWSIPLPQRFPGFTFANRAPPVR